MPALTVTPVTGVGAEVDGVDLRLLTAEEVDDLTEALGEHGVLFFRDQELTPVDHLELARRFGPINRNRFFTAHPDHDEIALVVKEPDDMGNIGGAWHTDHSYDEEPALGSILVAREVPPNGGDTLFASMAAAFDALDAATRAEISDAHAIHSARHVFGSATDVYGEGSADYEGRLGNAAAADCLDDAVHPMVIAHPISGRPTLYVNPVFVIGIVGMDHEPAFELLRRLYDHALRDRFVHRFRWEPGSVAFWDNRAVWHNALNDYPGHRREMHRITIEGCRLEPFRPAA